MKNSILFRFVDITRIKLQPNRRNDRYTKQIKYVGSRSSGSVSNSGLPFSIAFSPGGFSLDAWVGHTDCRYMDSVSSTTRWYTSCLRKQLNWWCLNTATERQCVNSSRRCRSLKLDESADGYGTSRLTTMRIHCCQRWRSRRQTGSWRQVFSATCFRAGVTLTKIQIWSRASLKFWYQVTTDFIEQSRTLRS